jgi:hypothetical protein
MLCQPDWIEEYLETWENIILGCVLKGVSSV